MSPATNGSKAPLRVYELKLDDDGSPSKEKSYVRLPAPVQPYVLRFAIDAGSLASKEGSLFTNLPPAGTQYERKKFWEHKLPGDVNKPIEVDLPIKNAGAFEYYVEYTAADEKIPYPTAQQPIFIPDVKARKRVQAKHGYFNVDPIMTAPGRGRILDDKLQPLPWGKGGEVNKGEKRVLSQDGIVLQSFIAKWAGSLSEWAPYLDVARDCGYNMLHFPPLQVRGESNSPYSIADQTDFSPDLFDAKAGKSSTKKERFATVKSWVDRIRDEWGILGMIDVVLNHTANNSEWLYEHPDAAYNPVNSPHLTPAAELDLALLTFSNKLAELGLPTDPKTDADVDAIMAGVKRHVLEPLKLWEYYAIDVKAQQEAFAAAWKKAGSANGSAKGTEAGSLDEAWKLLGDKALRGRLALGSRFGTTLDMTAAVSVMKGLAGDASDETITKAFAKAVNDLNVPLYKTYDEDVEAIIKNVGGRLKYQRIETGGPKMGPITPSAPLCEPYFTRLDPKHPLAKKRKEAELTLAHNGWIWAADPLMDFASSESRVYLRREVIAWGDCVKLRYGKSPADSPFLWKHMEEYCAGLAKLFAGFRIDNCHSTPLHVGEYFLDVARKANPDLYVCAELFTGSAEMDTLFVSRLGINSLIREMENGHDVKEESRLLYRFGVNKPIGSMDEDCLSRQGVADGQPATILPLQGSSPHALFMDVTHDNETPTAKRTTEDAATMGALVAFSWSAIGSTKGFDDLYPSLLNVVTEKRKYELPTSSPESKGIYALKRVFNHLHAEMVADGYSEGHVHEEGDFIMMHRTHPQTHQGYLVVTHTAFSANRPPSSIKPIKLNRTKARFILGKTLEITSREAPKDDAKTIKGFESRLVDVSAPKINEGQDNDGHFSEIVVPTDLKPASVMLFATYMDEMGPELDSLCVKGAKEAMAGLDLVDLNVVLYRADGEERDVTGGGDGVYTVPGLDKPGLVYCGLEGWMHPLRAIMKNNDLGHPLCDHLRKGTWALDYVHGRLEKQTSIFPRLDKPAAWLKERFDAIKAVVPSFMRPKYFAIVVNEAYKAARARALEQMSDFVREGESFTQALALVAVQLNGQVKSASLWHDRPVASMAAGLPFFSAGWARLWGRDVFISLRGLYLTTSMASAAREHILSFGSTLKHGMIPNLLNSTTNPRYNCRDGPWFFAQNVQDYTRMVPGGEAILKDTVKRRFPLDDEWVDVDSPKAFAHVSSVADIIQEILQRHASGIHFREHDAGPKIDEHMKDEGFTIDVEVDWATGIVFGGNAWNCGTWQDKNGSSAKAGNRGVPGSPRDGAAIEITGLVYSTLRWVEAMAAKGAWPEKGVQAIIGGKRQLVTYKAWADLIQKAFEKCYWVPLDPAEDASYRVDPGLVNRRGIYKDVFGSGKGREWSDYQFRSNFTMAMCVAPGLFEPKHAMTALQAAHCVLKDVLGMKTLDPSDRNYRPVYDNTNDTDDFNMAQGWSYHNGPPWVFPYGFFARAYLMFDLASGSGKAHGAEESYHLVSSLFRSHRKHIVESPWAGLPELTNADGKECPDSCPTQAWSASCILDALEGVRQHRIEGKIL